MSPSRMAPGGEVPIMWNGRKARAWCPAPLADRDLTLSPKSARATERAIAAIERAAGRLPLGWEPAARLLLRAEGVASSNIEGLRAPLADVVAAELVESDDRAAAWIAANLATVDDALASRHNRLTIAALHRWHRRLMEGSRLPRAMVGRFRTAQGWIGGTTPQDAVFVPPPPSEVASLMRDLVAFANNDEHDPVTQAAVLHAQFETIHPYGDGNGRIGRVLVMWCLAARLSIAVPPPVSVLIARNTGGYFAGLYQWRTGEADEWVRWFADVSASAGIAASAWADDAAALADAWRERLAGVRADAAAHAAIDIVVAHPVLTASTLAGELDVSDRSARSALSLLHERGIVEPWTGAPSGPGRPSAWWRATELLELVGRWSP